MAYWGKQVKLFDYISMLNRQISQTVGVFFVQVFVERCKYLEESKCVGVCTNTCKFPTQVSRKFFSFSVFTSVNWLL